MTTAELPHRVFYASSRHPHIWVLLCNGGDFTRDVKVYANSSLYLISMNAERIFLRYVVQSNLTKLPMNVYVCTPKEKTKCVVSNPIFDFIRK